MNGESQSDAVEELLAFLRDGRGLDFTGYKRPSLVRRIRKRMEVVGVATFEEYRDLIEANPHEHDLLLDTVLINVTGFYRDPDAWTYLAREVVPAIVDRKAPGERIRIWSTGCATGEEAFTLAMIFADHLGVEEFKSRVKIYATDTDESALAVGRTGRFSADRLDPVPVEQRERYFEPVGADFQFRPDCRRAVIFGRLDITRDAPISRLDLLVCRNVLMYFVRDTQRKVLDRFHYALGDDGYLFLGRAETILAHADLFTSASQKHRIFQRVPGPPRREVAIDTPNIDVDSDGPENHLRRLASAASPVAQLVVDINGKLVEANNKALAMFGLTSDDIGRTFHDLEVSYRPVDLRSHITQAHVEGHPVTLRAVERPLADGESQFLEVSIAPLVTATGVAQGASVTFADVTELGRIRADLERSARELAIANQELQSTNEELETTNEELQSANEELETMNEELQSANEELETMNVELVEQGREIERSGAFLSALLDSLSVGVAVVDEQLDVVVWNRSLEHRFGLSANEAVGRSVLALDIGLPVAELGPVLHAIGRDAGGTPAEVELDAITRAGRPFRCRVVVERLAVPESHSEARQLVLLVDELRTDSP